MQAAYPDKLQSPTRFYDSPSEVLTDRELDRDQKREVLRSWLQDAKRLAESEAENMSGGEPNRVGEISLALNQLN